MKKADLVLTRIKSFVCQIIMKRGELYNLQEEKRRNKELVITTGNEARQKQLKTPTPDNASEDATTGSSEKDQSTEGNHAGRNRK